ncbi:MAG: type II secretion system protein N, partial [Ottowia sp.]|nr:type II secretion system protein N [Ottowia sp.]
MKLRRPARPAASNSAAPWRWAVAGTLVGALLAVLLAAPARWLGALLAHVSEGAVQLLETDGSVWNGSARLLLTGGEGSRDRLALPGRIHWQLAPGL